MRKLALTVALVIPFLSLSTRLREPNKSHVATAYKTWEQYHKLANQKK